VDTITMGMVVHASDGTAGRIDDVLANRDTGRPAYLVIDAGFFKGDVVTPIDSVQSVDDAGVWLAMTRDEVKHAPAYDAARYGAPAGLVSHAANRYGKQNKDKDKDRENR
jgi:hypothetical protein